jgi:hypothetical protein
MIGTTCRMNLERARKIRKQNHTQPARPNPNHNEFLCPAMLKLIELFVNLACCEKKINGKHGTGKIPLTCRTHFDDTSFINRYLI